MLNNNISNEDDLNVQEEKKSLSSKILSNREFNVCKIIKDFDEERHIGEVLRGVGINPEFFILPLNSCEYNITNTDKNKFWISIFLYKIPC